LGSAVFAKFCIYFFSLDSLIIVIGYPVDSLIIVIGYPVDSLIYLGERRTS
jgi:hypothetical protein